jgi:hypothetical protein
MLNNLTNLFNLIKSRMVKTVLENDDLIVVGTKDGKYNGGYKPTIIKFSDLATQLNAGEVESVTDDGNGIVSVDNTDTANPIIEFNGVNTDGITITGDGSVGSPLVATIIPNTNFGLFSQTGNSAPITGTTVETTLINGGVGTLTVPANSFVKSSKLSTPISFIFPKAIKDKTLYISSGLLLNGVAEYIKTF